jgi:predicted NBD/HSP70 family sugar kinase
VTTPGTPRLLRSINDRSAMRLLLEHGALTRAQLSDLTGLSKPTTGQLLARLQSAGAVVTDGFRTGQRGPQAEVYRLEPGIAFAAGVDVTPARVRVAVADVTGAVLAIREFRTTRDSVVPTLTVREVVDETLAAAGLHRKQLTCAVIGTPGALDPITGKLGYARHLRGWHRDDLAASLRESLGVPLSIVNDVKLAAVAELAHRGPLEQDFCLLWNGDGLGLAHVSAGQVLSGARGGAGEVGYMPVPGTSLQRKPSRSNNGGYQTRAGAVAARHLMAAAGFPGRTAAVAVGRAVTAAQDGDRRADRAVQELAQRMSVGLASICCVLDPPVVILAGDICAAGGDLLRMHIERELAELTINPPPVRRTAITEHAVLKGAVHAAVTDARDTAFAKYLN